MKRINLAISDEASEKLNKFVQIKGTNIDTVIDELIKNARELNA